MDHPIDGIFSENEARNKTVTPKIYGIVYTETVGKQQRVLYTNIPFTCAWYDAPPSPSLLSPSPNIRTYVAADFPSSAFDDT